MVLEGHRANVFAYKTPAEVAETAALVASDAVA
jgi:hypothetical protein